jgi:hypothetical protein
MDLVLGPFVTDSGFPVHEINGFCHVGKSLEYSVGGDVFRSLIFERIWPRKISKRFHHFDLFVPVAPHSLEARNAPPSADDLVEIGAFLIAFFRASRSAFEFDELFAELVAQIPGLIDNKALWPVSPRVLAKLEASG